MKIIHWIISIGILLFNIFYFLEISFEIIKTDGGAMGFGYMILPFVIPINFLMIPALLSFNKRFADHNFIFLINLLGLLWTVYCFSFFNSISF